MNMCMNVYSNIGQKSRDVLMGLSKVQSPIWSWPLPKIQIAPGSKLSGHAAPRTVISVCLFSCEQCIIIIIG